MTKIEFLAASLPDGLKCEYVHKTLDKIEVKYKIFKLDCIDFGQSWKYWTSDKEFTKHFSLAGKGFRGCDFKPIIRHIDTLTQECVQADYNEGKPFIPIVELGKLIRNGYWYLDNNGATVADKDLFLFLSYTDVDGYFYCEDLNNGNLVSVNQLQLFQQLIRWHYWPNKPENEEVVYVTETFNPYK